MRFLCKDKKELYKKIKESIQALIEALQEKANFDGVTQEVSEPKEGKGISHADARGDHGKKNVELVEQLEVIIKEPYELMLRPKNSTKMMRYDGYFESNGTQSELSSKLSRQLQ